MISKATWILRGLIYKIFFGQFNLPSYIGKPVFIGNFKRIFIGKRVRIFPGARIEVVNLNSSIYFGDNLSIGQNLHITSAGKLTIGSNTTIAGNVTITNIDHEYREIGISIVDQEYIIKKTTIGNNCYLGKGSIIQAGTILGEQCIVGANSVVRGVFPNYCVIVGIPAKIIKKYNPINKSWQKTNNDGTFKHE